MREYVWLECSGAVNEITASRRKLEARTASN